MSATSHSGAGERSPLPMLPVTMEWLEKPVPTTSSTEPFKWGKTVSEARAWGQCVWTMDEAQRITGELLLGDPTATRVAAQQDNPANTLWPYVAASVGIAAWGLAAYLYLTHATVPWLMPVIVTLLLGVGVHRRRTHAARRARRYPITAPAMRLLTIETQTMGDETRDAGLLALVRAAITHPEHHTDAAADAVAACVELVAVARATPMQTTTTATLEALADQAAHGDPAMWPEVQDAAIEQAAKVEAWRAANDQVAAAVEAPIREAHRDAVRGAFAALDEQTSIEATVLPIPLPTAHPKEQ